MSEDRQEAPDGYWEPSSSSASSHALAKTQLDFASWTICVLLLYNSWYMFMIYMFY